jgi:hypothetical protein
MAVALPIMALEVLDNLGLLLLTVPVVVILGAVWDEVRQGRRTLGGVGEEG